MYNSKVPDAADLPSSGQLLRSTVIAAGVAAVLLVTAILPAEYGIDPTGVGRMLGLTQMGEIKEQLHQEAEADRARDQTNAPAAPPTNPDRRSGLLTIIAGLAISPASAQTAPVVVAQAARTDETSISLRPGQGLEVKLEMRKGAEANYSWKTSGGGVNFDMHGEGAGNASKSYKKGRGAASDEGVLQAAFDGSHGWFWRNRGSGDVTVTLRTSGEYSAIKQLN